MARRARPRRGSTSSAPTTWCAVRKQTGLRVDDLLEAKAERGKITLTSKSFIDRELGLALEDVRNGRTHGPLDSVDALMGSLRRGSKKRRRAKSC